MTAGEKLYMEGHLEEALPMLRGEAKEGDSRAWFFLGLAALYGIGDERENPAEGAARFRKGSAGDSLCLLFSAFFLPEGAVSAEGLRKAFLSAEGGEDGPAGLFAAACILRRGLSGAAEADLEKSRALFEQAAAAGFWQAEYELGLSLLNENEEADKVRGAALMKSAADKGAGIAEYRMGFCCIAGIGMEKNPSLGASYYRRAWKHGCAKAAVELGVFYESGVYVKKDEKKAGLLYKKAAEAGDAEGKAHWGDFLADGRGGKKDKKGAEKLWREAARAGSAYAVLRLGEEVFNGGEEGEAFRYFLESARMGLPAAQYLTGICLIGGRGTEKNEGAGAEWLLRAARGGSREAADWLMKAGLL